jgi:hypothetical protein
MKLLTRIVLGIVTVSSCAMASAQLSSSEDQARRTRNREEAMANYQRMQQGNASSTDSRTSRTGRSRDGERHVGANVRDAAHAGANTVRSTTHRAASSTRSFTHRQASKLRNFGERQQRKFPNRTATQSGYKSDAALGK